MGQRKLKMANSNITDWKEVPVDDWQEVPVEPSVSTGEAVRRGFAKGGTLGWSDELGAGVQALLEKVSGLTAENEALKAQGFKGDIGPTSLGEAYTQSLGEERAAEKAAEAAHPTAYASGQIIGGLAMPFPLVGGAKLAGEGVKGALKLGALTGAASGLGESEAETLGGKLKDMATGAAIGTSAGALVPAIGGIAKGVKAGAKFLAEETPIQQVIESFKRGTKGQALVGKSAVNKAAEEFYGKAKEVSETLDASLDSAGKAINSAIAKGNVEGKQYDIKSLIDTAKKEAQNLPEYSTADENAKKETLKIIENILEGKEITSKAKRIIPGKEVVQEKTIPAKAGSFDKLNKEADRLTEQSKLSGENATYNVIETTGSDGKKYHSLVKRTREVSSEQPEKLVPVKGEEGISEFKLQKGQSEPLMAPGQPEDTFGEGIKEGIKVKTVPAEEPSLEKIIRSVKSTEPKVVEDVITGRLPQSPVKTLEELTTLRRQLQPNTLVGEKSLATPESAGIITKLVKGIKEQLPQEVEQASGEYSKLKQLQDLFKQKDIYTTGDEITASEKLTRMLSKFGSESPSDAIKQLSLKEMSDLAKNQPKLYQQLTKEVPESAQKLALTQEITKGMKGQTGAFRGSLALASAGANLAGRGLNEATPDVVKNLATKGMQIWGDKGRPLAEKLMEMANKDQKARNALVFSLQQNPTYREMLRQLEE